MRNGMSTLAKGSGDGPQCSHFWTIAAQVEDAICMCDVDIYPSSTEPTLALEGYSWSRAQHPYFPSLFPFCSAIGGFRSTHSLIKGLDVRLFRL
jgi:hypothetical protein